MCQQAQVLEVLVNHYNAGRTFQNVAAFLLQQVLLPNGSQAFAEAEILQRASSVAAKRMPRGMPMSDVRVRLFEAEHREQITALSAVGLGRWARGRLVAADCEGISLRTVLLLETLICLCSESELTFEDALGQVLWKSRCCEPVRKSEHFMTIADDLSWICRSEGDQQIDFAKDFFRAITADTGRRMYWRQWVKVGQILQGNPVLSKRIEASDLDRLFYQETRRHPTDKGHCLNRTSFIRCLTILSETMKTHPKVIFVCFASHAEALTAELEEQPH